MKHIIPLLSAIALVITSQVKSVPLEATRGPQHSGHLPSLQELEDGNIIIAQGIEEDKGESIVIAGKRLLLERESSYSEDVEDEPPNPPFAPNSDDDANIHPVSHSTADNIDSANAPGSEASSTDSDPDPQPEFFPFDCSKGLSYVNEEDGAEVYLTGEEVCSKLGIADHDSPEVGQESAVIGFAEEEETNKHEIKRQLGVLHVLPQEGSIPLPLTNPDPMPSDQQPGSSPGPAPSEPASDASLEVEQIVAGELHIGDLEDKDPAPVVGNTASNPVDSVTAVIPQQVDAVHLIPQADDTSGPIDTSDPLDVNQKQGIVSSIVNGVKNIFSGGNSDGGVLHLVPQQDDDGKSGETSPTADTPLQGPLDQVAGGLTSGDSTSDVDNEIDPENIVQDEQVHIGSTEDEAQVNGSGVVDVIGQIEDPVTGGQTVQDNMPGQRGNAGADLSLGQQSAATPPPTSETQPSPGPSTPTPTSATQSPDGSTGSDAPLETPSSSPAATPQDTPAPTTDASPAPTSAALTTTAPSSDAAYQQPSTQAPAPAQTSTVEPSNATPATPTTCNEGYDADGIYQACDYSGENPGAYLGGGAPTSVSSASAPGPTCTEGYDSEGIYQACGYEGENSGAYLGEGGQNQDGTSVLPANGIVGQLPVSAVPCKLDAGGLININALVDIGELVDLCVWAGVFVPEGYTPCPEDLQHYIPVHATTDGTKDARKRSPQLDFVDGDEDNESMTAADPKANPEPAQQALSPSTEASPVALPESDQSDPSNTLASDSSNLSAVPGPSGGDETSRELIRLCVTGGAL